VSTDAVSCRRQYWRVVAERMSGSLGRPIIIAAALTKGIKALFKQEPDREWRNYSETIAEKRTGVGR
jgi:hypothetical protein